jgi:hypothetical protein
MMSVAIRFARTIVVLVACVAVVGCFGSKDTTPESDIPDIPPATRTVPGEGNDSGDDFIPAQPPR